MEKLLQSIWESLTTENIVSSGWMCKRIDPIEPFAILLAVHFPVHKYAMILEIPSDTLTTETKLPSTKYISIYPQYNPVNNLTQIFIELLNDEFLDIFAVLCNDLRKVIISSPDPNSAIRHLISRMIEWQSFLKSMQPQGLNEQEQLGLYGELWLLKNRLLPLFEPLSAIKSWTGPFGTNQDFQFGRSALEAKTSSTRSSMIHISNILQLDDSILDHLFLHHLSVDTRNGVTDTLVDIVLSIREVLNSSDKEALSIFNNALMSYGFLDIHSEKYRDKCYIFRASTYYRVQDKFPRITPDSVPVAVDDIRYTLNLSSCNEYVVTDDTVNSVLMGVRNV